MAKRIGIYQSYWGRVGGGQRYVAVAAAVLARRHAVEIVHHAQAFDIGQLEDGMQVDLSGIEFRFVPRPERPAALAGGLGQRLKEERELGREISAGYDVFIDSSDNVPYFCHARRGVLLVHFPLVRFEQFHGHETRSFRRRSLFKRLLSQSYHLLEWRQRFATYELCVVNSEFTRGWIRKRWGLPSTVVFPPLREGLAPAEKAPFILSIGAFHNAQHKKHAELIDAFRSIADRATPWRLIMVGACGSAAEDARFVESLRERIGEAPIEIRTNLPGAELNDLLARSSLFWHAMGYGVDEGCAPERMEHFGMVACEAMAAGSVPVVFDGGGLREIVEHGRSGMRWRTLDELCQQTLALIGDERRRRELSAAAVVGAERFAMPAFERSLWRALSPVLGPAPAELEMVAAASA